MATTATTTAATTATTVWRPATMRLILDTVAAYDTAALSSSLSPHQSVSLGYRLLTAMLKKINEARDEDWCSVEGDEPFPSSPSSPSISPSSSPHTIHLSPLSSPIDAPIILPLAALLPFNTKRLVKRHKH